MPDRWRLVTRPDGQPLLLRTLAVHAALLPSGKVLFFSGSEHDETATRMSETGLFDPAAETVRYLTSPTRDLFCSGHCMLPSGDVFVAGGTAAYDRNAPEPHRGAHHFTGIANCHVFDWRREEWFEVAPMAAARWYPTCVVLPDGTVLAMSGHGGAGPVHENTTFEVFDPTTATWSPARSPTPALEDTGKVLGRLPMVYYPRMFVLLNGQVLSATAQQDTTHQRRVRSLDVPSGLLTTLADQPSGGKVWASDDVYSRSAYSAVLLPLRPPGYGQAVLIVGERQPRKLDVNNAHLGWLDAGAPRPYRARAYATAVLLPDGSVLVVNGGTTERLPRLFPPTGDTGGEDKDAISWAEQYLPDTDQWVTRSAPSYQAIPRMYHSVALLLPDARVWIAGSNHDSGRGREARELRVEIYEPPYLFNGVDADGNPRPADRPVITSTRRGAAYGQEFAIGTPRPRDISTVALLRAASVTHAFSPDQRYVRLRVVRRTDDAVVVEAPPSSRIAPPGYYMLFLSTLGDRPSVARMLRIGHRYPLLALSVRTESMPFFGQVLAPGDHPPDDLTMHLGSKRPGETVTATVRATNAGTGTLVLSDVRVTGGFRTEASGGGLFGEPVLPANTNLVVAPSAGAGPGGWVDVTVNHTAEAYGTTRGNLEFITTAEDASFVRIALDLLVEGLEIAVPSSLGFGAVQVGSQSQQDMMLRNVGTVPASLVDLTVSDPQFAVPFVLANRALPAGGELRLPVWCTPTRVGDLLATLTVTVEGTPAPSRWHQSYTLPLTVTGVGGIPVVVPDRLTFSDQRVRTASPPRQVALRNAGNGPLTVTDVLCGNDFRCVSGCTAAVPPGGTCTLTVAFAPAHAGPLADSLLVRADAGEVRVELSGVGLAEPIAVLDPATLAFADRSVGVGGPPLPVTVTNDGVVALQVQAIAVTGADAADFTVAEETCTAGTILPERDCTIRVEFRPAAAGGRSALLEITTNAHGSPHVVPLLGTGLAAAARTLDPVAVDLPATAVGKPTPQLPVLLTNTGAGPLTVLDVQLLGPDASEFAVDDACRGEVLNPGQQCTMRIAAIPGRVGRRSATLRVTDDRPGSPTDVPLSATGLGAVVRFDPPALEFDPMVVGGFSSRQDIELVNEGNTPLPLAAVVVTGDFRYRTFCSGALPPGGRCVTQVLCVPSQPGERVGELAVSDGGTTWRATLRGRGAAAVRPSLRQLSHSATFPPEPPARQRRSR